VTAPGPAHSRPSHWRRTERRRSSRISFSSHTLGSLVLQPAFICRLVAALALLYFKSSLRPHAKLDAPSAASPRLAPRAPLAVVVEGRCQRRALLHGAPARLLPPSYGPVLGLLVLPPLYPHVIHLGRALAPSTTFILREGPPPRLHPLTRAEPNLEPWANSFSHPSAAP
jgi:hypothetical protein